MPASYSRLLGVVGKPNTGKSTFFSAATLATAEIANYPFTTIKPNRGVGYVRTPCVHTDFKVQDNPNNSLCLDGVRLAPVELIDIAGIVPGAWEGRGLGNQFLDEIRRADALIHIVDASGGTDCEGKSCKPGEHDPVEDVQFLEREITMWMASILRKDWPKIARTAEIDKKGGIYGPLEEKLTGLGIKRNQIFDAVRKAGLNADKPAQWSEEDFLKFLDTLRRIAKPMLIVANKMDLPTSEATLERLKKLDYTVIPASAEAELALRRAAEKKLIEYKPGDPDFKILQPEKLSAGQIKALEAIREKIIKHGTTGVQEAINNAYFKLLNMITVYPVEDVEHLTNHNGQVLPDVYLVPQGTTAHQFAYIIHTELGESFLYAIDAHDKRRIGEDAILKDREVISIVSTKKRA